MTYRYQEYPKVLYCPDGAPAVVEDAHEERVFLARGYQHKPCGQSDAAPRMARCILAEERGLRETRRRNLGLPTAELSPRLEAAVAWLIEVLEHGPVRATDIEAQARKAGHAMRTLKLARYTIGVIAHKRSYRAGWDWMLPTDAWRIAKQANTVRA